jgi:hypothetical protein
VKWGFFKRLGHQSINIAIEYTPTARCLALALALRLAPDVFTSRQGSDPARDSAEVLLLVPMDHEGFQVFHQGFSLNEHCECTDQIFRE